MNTYIDIESVVSDHGKKGFSKIVWEIDRTKNGGFCFIGKFLIDGQNEVPVNAVIVEKKPAPKPFQPGIMNIPAKWRTGKVQTNGTIKWHPINFDAPDQFSGFLEVVSCFLNSTPPAKDEHEIILNDKIRDSLHYAEKNSFVNTSRALRELLLIPKGLKPKKEPNYIERNTRPVINSPRKSPFSKKVASGQEDWY